MTVRTRDHGVVLFPPIDYVMHLAQKAGYLSHLSANVTLPPHIHIPPMCMVDITKRSWRKKVAEFAEVKHLFFFTFLRVSLILHAFSSNHLHPLDVLRFQGGTQA